MHEALIYITKVSARHNGKNSIGYYISLIHQAYLKQVNAIEKKWTKAHWVIATTRLLAMKNHDKSVIGNLNIGKSLNFAQSACQHELK